MIDVRRGLGAKRREDRVNELLERALLLDRARRPEPDVRALDEIAEQVLATAVGREPVSFEIEKDVARARLGQLREAVLRSERLEDLVLR